MILNKENKYKGYLNIDEVTYRGKKGKDIKREVMFRKNAVASLVYNTLTKKYIFVSQWRAGAGGDVVEIPAGVLDHKSEDPRDAMIREIEEETGYAVDSLILLEEGYVSPGGTTEMITIYFAKVSDKIGEGGGVEDEDEEIDIIEMDEEEMESTRFKDFKTIIAVNWLKHNKGDLQL